MAGQSKKTPTATRRKPPAPKPAPEAEPSLADLARGILSKEIRPRIAHIRRLAEAALAGGSAKPKKAKKGKADGGRKKDKSKKLAKIPGQRTKK